MKKIINLLLVFAIVIGTMNFGIISANAEEQWTDTNQAEHDLELLVALNIMNSVPSKTEAGYNTITRGEFVKYVTKVLMSGNNSSNLTAKQVFDDVTSSSPYYTEISYAYDLGLINGFTDNTFRPEETLRYGQMVKMLVCMLNMQVVAEKRGGYPSGYVTIAAQNEFAKSLPVDSEVTYDVFANCLVNSLDTKPFQQVLFSNNYEQVAESSQTLLWKNFKVEKVEGIITSNADTSLVGTSSLNDDEIEVDYQDIYSVGKTNLYEYLGYNNIIYVKETVRNEQKEAIYTYPKKTTALTVDSRSIDEVDMLNRRVTYYTDNDTKKNNAKISTGISVIYNGSYYNSDIEDMLKPENGTITFIDNNNDGLNDVAFVNEPETILVSTANSITNEIKDKYSDKKVIADETSVHPKTIIRMDGGKISISEIKEWDVVSVFRDKNNEFLKLEITRNVIQGKPTKIKMNGEDSTVVIDDVTYKFSKSFLEALNSQNPNVPDVTTDSLYTFYLDANNDIAGAKRVTTTDDLVNIGTYGFITGMTKGDNVQDCTVKFYTPSGEFKTYQLAEKIKVDGTNVSFDEIATTSLYKNESPIKQLVFFKLNSNDEVKSITTAVDCSGSTDKNYINSLISNGTFRKNGEKASRKYLSGNMSLDKFYLTSSTIIMTVPNEGEDYSNTDLYSIGMSNTFYNGSSYTTEVYDASTLNVANVVVNYYSSSSSDNVSADQSYKLIESVSETLNKNDEVVYEVTAYDNGKQVKYLTSESIKNMPELDRGDLVQWKLNDKNEILSIKLTYSPDPVKDETADTRYRIAGTLLSRDSDFYELEGHGVVRFGGTRVYVIYKNSRQGIEVGGNSDIGVGMYAVFRTYDNSTREVFLYEQ